LAEALGSSITELVRLQLDQLLAVPRQINVLNASAIREGASIPTTFPTGSHLDQPDGGVSGRLHQ